MSNNASPTGINDDLSAGNMLADRSALETAIASDLTACQIGMTLTKGKVRRRYARQQHACFEQIKAWNRQDGLDTMTDDDLLAALGQ